MSKTIVHKVVFKNASVNTIYNLYMNAKKHSESTGALAKIISREGSKFSAHGGYITGKNLQLIKNKLIVQSWRAQGWDKADVDSTFIIRLEQRGIDVVLNAIHANIPDKAVAGIDKGWYASYWEPWKKFLAGKPVAKSPAM